MPELTILCAGAALDRSSQSPKSIGLALDQSQVRARLAKGGFAQLFRRARAVSDLHDQSLVPQDLPEHAWLGERIGLAQDDAIEAHAAWCHALKPGARLLTPSHVTIGLDHALLSDPSTLEFSEDESQELAAVAKASFATHGFSLHAVSSSAWFLTGERQLNLQARSWQMAAGRNVDAYLPSGPDARLWRLMLSELQMLWHQHPVNLARQSRGAPPVNMLWLGGKASHVPERCSLVLWSPDASLSQAIRGAGGLAPDPRTSFPLPEAFDALVATALEEKLNDLIIALPGWSQARRQDDPAQWMDYWLRFDDWLRQIEPQARLPSSFTALRALLTGERRQLELRRERNAWWKPWRRLDPLGLAL